MVGYVWKDGMSPEEEANGAYWERNMLALRYADGWYYDTENNWDKDHLFAQMKQLSELMGYKLRDFLFPLFIAIAGTNQTVSVMDSMSILGPDMSRARLRHAVNLLGGPSKKEAKRWEKEFRDIAAQLA